MIKYWLYGRSALSLGLLYTVLLPSRQTNKLKTLPSGILWIRAVKRAFLWLLGRIVGNRLAFGSSSRRNMVRNYCEFHLINFNWIKMTQFHSVPLDKYYIIFFADRIVWQFSNYSWENSNQVLGTYFPVWEIYILKMLYLIIYTT